ncbi:helix-turn-helix domain-containing protein [Kyrpidia spormannii]|uniref:XRE family transcriptional regulator n=2 Tax=Kyrpidia spormannii TaxID=2055160 RepID=A0ACA8Z8B8_9BACL|nr:helix-turn-helix transcriptional regulator [Kyrpidia spormannii]CAB3391672.1 XRE family transcriptional regulator [Kyrpidia spormannii]CAB3392585.1 XRE family transcriptional regulator [Kyrpidia spormannii]
MREITTLRLLRFVTGTEQGELAATIGVSKQVVSQAETGIRAAYPRVRRLLAAYYETSESALFDARGFARLVPPQVLEGIRAQLAPPEDEPQASA